LKIDYFKGILAGAITGLADDIVSNISNYTGG